MYRKGFILPVTSALLGGVMLVASTGVLPQRLNWRTTTNTDFSYALSYPPSWSAAGSGTLLTLSNGRSLVSVQSGPITPGTDVSGWATEQGAVSGFLTTTVNAYSALESVQGAATTYYIVNGAVGYKISVLDQGDPGTIRTILLTFTVTRQR